MKNILRKGTQIALIGLVGVCMMGGAALPSAHAQTTGQNNAAAYAAIQATIGQMLGTIGSELNQMQLSVSADNAEIAALTVWISQVQTELAGLIGQPINTPQVQARLSQIQTELSAWITKVQEIAARRAAQRTQLSGFASVLTALRNLILQLPGATSTSVNTVPNTGGSAFSGDKG